MAKDRRGVERAKDGNGRFCRSLEQLEEDKEAARLYGRVCSYSEVARLQKCNVSTAYRRVHRAFAVAPDDSIDTARRVALARLSAQAVIAQHIAESEFVAHSNGRVVYLSDEPLVDVSANLAALDRLLRIEDQRARLLGLHAPTAARIEVIPSDVLEDLVRENERLIAAAETELGIRVSPVPRAAEPTSEA